MILFLLRWAATLTAAFLAGKLASRVRLSAILGWLIAGMLLGPHAAGLLPQAVLDEAWYRTTIMWMQCAFGIMLGSELIGRKLKRSGKALLVTTLTQSMGTFLQVSAAFALVFARARIPLYLAFAFGGIALATAPAPALSIVNEFHARGPVTDTLLPPEVRLGRKVEAVGRPVSEFSFAVKTNLLADLVTAVNLGVEVPLGENFSVNAHFTFPWWTAGPYGNKYALQLLDAEGELRWWFAKGEERFEGHYLALQGSGGKFDLQWGRDIGCYQCYNWGVGLSYGYAMSLGKHLNMEFALTLGYLAIDYQHYVPSPDWSVLLRDNAKAGVLHYFGPTGLKVSLVYPFHIQRRGRR